LRINKNIEAKPKLLLNPLFPTLKKEIIHLFIVSLPKVPEFSRENIDRLENHLSREQFLQEGEMAANNAEMINRARAIERGELEATDTDKAFLTHELRERELRETGMEYNEAHAQTCKEYGFDANAENTEPHPFYTKEAQDAFDKAELERAIR